MRLWGAQPPSPEAAHGAPRPGFTTSSGQQGICLPICPFSMYDSFCFCFYASDSSRAPAR
jgi:hypothetical protein